MSGTRRLTTVDSHTAGHPTRVVTDGLPPLQGRSVAEKCDWFERNLDGLRTFLLHEPRGHSAMVGAVLTDSDVADFGAFFLGSYNYLPMCGHATIGLAATFDFLDLIEPGDNGRADFSLEVPAGVIEVAASYEGSRLDTVGFANVPAFVAAKDVPLPLHGQTLCDIAYGGNWYALVAARDAGLALSPSATQAAMAAGARIKQDINDRIATGKIAGASEPIHSVLFYESFREEGVFVSRQLVVLAANKFDRSPCGTGSSARLAQMIERGEIQAGERIRARNILDVDFFAYAHRIPGAETAGAARYRPWIEGLAHITGQHIFIRTDDDPLATGFLCG